MSHAQHEARLNLRLPGEIKRLIEDAAALTGQSPSQFAVHTLAQAARRVLHERDVTRLSARDRRLFAAMLDNQATAPNAALRKAARRHRQQVGPR